jgi:hypothetical protein
MLLHHPDFRSLTDHLRLLRFVEHSSQRLQSAVGIRGRAGKSQLLSEISCDLVDSQTCNGCRLQQPPAIAVELLGFLFQPGIVHPGQEALSKRTKSSGLAWKGSVLCITEASFRLAACSTRTDFVS